MRRAMASARAAATWGSVVSKEPPGAVVRRRTLAGAGAGEVVARGGTGQSGADDVTRRDTILTRRGRRPRAMGPGTAVEVHAMAAESAGQCRPVRPTTPEQKEGQQSRDAT